MLGREEFEREWERRVDEERRFAADVLAGRFADCLQDESHGEYLSDLVSEDDAMIISDDIERLNVAVIAWMAARDLGDALRHVRSGSWKASLNVGFAFESDFFRLASYDWSEDEDENGDVIDRHDFELKPAGIHLDWYKWMGRDNWASPGLAAAIRAADEQGIPTYVWWEAVMDACIDSLMATDEAETHRIQCCGWRHYDAGAVPHRVVRVAAEIASGEVEAVTMDSETEGYVAFKEDRILGAFVPNDLEDVTDAHPDVVAATVRAIAQSAGDRLSQAVQVRLECPDDIGYLVIGRRAFCRLVLDETAEQMRDRLIAEDEDGE